MSTTLEVRGLLENKARLVNIPVELQEVFETWKELRKKSYNKDVSEIEIFYAGYVLANPVVKEKYKKLRGKENEN